MVWEDLHVDKPSELEMEMLGELPVLNSSILAVDTRNEMVMQTVQEQQLQQQEESDKL